MHSVPIGSLSTTNEVASIPFPSLREKANWQQPFSQQKPYLPLGNSNATGFRKAPLPATAGEWTL